MEKAFKVKKDSKLYQDYFRSEAERKKFKEFGNTFFNKIGYKGAYTLTRNLMVKNNLSTLSEFFPNELCKYANSDDLYKFKVKSKTQKRWEEEVVSQIDMEAYNAIKFWWMNCIWSGRYAIWNYNGEVYGMLESKKDIKLTEDMEEIKMSEYYKIIEEIKNEHES